MVPIVMGGADYSQHAPDHSYINAADFQSPQDLAQYLLFLSGNQDEYFKYFKWKKYYSIVRRFPICGLCEMLHNPNLPRKSYSDLYHWWYGNDENDYCINGDDMPYNLT
jgi:alpha-1,3-fucosyltransferase